MQTKNPDLKTKLTFKFYRTAKTTFQMSWFVTYVMLRFVHYSDVTWATYAVSTHWQLDCLYISSFGLMSKETSMVQYGEESFFFYWFLSFTSPVLPITPDIFLILNCHGLYHFSLMKGNIKDTHYWPFVSGFHRWIPLTMRKVFQFHAIMNDALWLW